MSLISAFRDLPEDESDLRARKARADRARLLLNDELFKGALQGVRDGIFREFADCPPHEVERLRQYRLMYELLDRIVGAIGDHIRDGEIADDALKTIEKRRLFGK